jgi:hypothetical protein
MPKRTSSRTLTNETLRDALIERTGRLRPSASRSIADASAHLSAALNELTVPAAAEVPSAPLPLIEPIWSFWLDAARLARITTDFSARQIDAPTRGSARRIPKLDLPQPLITALTTWFNDHRDGTRASAREANYRAHYDLRLPGANGKLKPSQFLDDFHAVLVAAVRHQATPGSSHMSTLLFLLRRLHIGMSHTASLIVDGVPTSEVFQRLGESLSLGRSDLLVAQWLLANPAIVAAVRGLILVPYPEQWMPPLDRLRQLTDTLDSLNFFYHDLAVTSESLLLSIRFGNWIQPDRAAAANWATFWQDDIARYLVAYEELTGTTAGD